MVDVSAPLTTVATEAPRPSDTRQRLPLSIASEALNAAAPDQAGPLTNHIRIAHDIIATILHIHQGPPHTAQLLLLSYPPQQQPVLTQVPTATSACKTAHASMSSLRKTQYTCPYQTAAQSPRHTPDSCQCLSYRPPPDKHISFLPSPRDPSYRLANYVTRAAEQNSIATRSRYTTKHS
jgi:hypothetical protein